MVLERNNASSVWIGKPSLWHDIYDEAHGEGGGLETHPSDKWKKVYAALRKSKKFMITGKIRSTGIHSRSRETLHPVFEVAKTPPNI